MSTNKDIILKEKGGKKEGVDRKVSEKIPLVKSASQRYATKYRGVTGSYPGLIAEEKG